MSALAYKVIFTLGVQILIGLLAIVGGTVVWFVLSATAPQEPFTYNGEYEARHGRACLSYGYGEGAWFIRISKDGTGFRARLNGRLLLVRFPELRSWTLESEPARRERSSYDRDGLNLVFEGPRREQAIRMRILRMTAPVAPAPDRFVILDRFVLENRNNGTDRDLMAAFPQGPGQLAPYSMLWDDRYTVCLMRR